MRNDVASKTGGRDGTRWTAVALAAVLILLAGPAAGQIPDELKNLEVLPKDVEKRQLVEVMKGFC